MDSMSDTANPIQRLLHPAVVLLAISLFAFFGWVLLPGGLQRSHGDASAYVLPDATDIEPVKGEMTPPVDLDAALEPSDEQLARGQELYRTYCATCHGDAGAGDGPGGQALEPKPRSFLQAEGWTRGHRLTDIYRTLSQGIPGTGMVAYDYLSPEDRFALAHVVRSFGAFEPAADDVDTIETLDQEFRLSTGVEEPSRAPVSRVVENMVQASQGDEPAAIPLPWSGDQSEGARLCRLLVEEPQRAARTLGLDQAWREDSGALARIVVSGAPGNGFSASSTSLTPNDWETFRTILGEIVPMAEDATFPVSEEAEDRV